METTPTIRDTAQNLADNLAAGNSPFPDTALQVGHDSIAHLENREHTVLAQANALAPTNQDTYDETARFVLECVKPLEREVKETFDPIVSAANKTHKEAVAQRDKHLKPLTEAKKIATAKCKIYEDEQHRLRREEQDRLDLEARRVAAKQQHEDAAHAEQMGEDSSVVDAIFEEKVTPPPVVAASSFERMPGITRKAPLKAEVINLVALIQFVAVRQHLTNYLLPNQSALNAAARSQGTKLDIPGVKVIST